MHLPSFTHESLTQSVSHIRLELHSQLLLLILRLWILEPILFLIKVLCLLLFQFTTYQLQLVFFLNLHQLLLPLVLMHYSNL